MEGDQGWVLHCAESRRARGNKPGVPFASDGWLTGDRCHSRAWRRDTNLRLKEFQVKHSKGQNQDSHPLCRASLRDGMVRMVLDMERASLGVRIEHK